MEHKKQTKEEKKAARAEKIKGMSEEAKSGRQKIRRIMTAILFVAVIGGCFFGYYSYSQSANYFITDNAKVTAKMYNIMPVTAGELLEWNVELGDMVTKNQVMGRQNILPYITSPIDGMIIKNDGSEGQIVSQTNPVAIVADTENLYIGVNIEETDIARIHTGQDVEVTLDAYKGKKFKGEVTEIEQTTQQFFGGTSSFSTSGTYTKVTQLIPVRVDIENLENLPLTFGMNATVKIYLKSDGGTQESTDKKNAAAKNDTYTTSVEAKTQMSITPDITGKVTAVYAQEGQSVKAGDVLFTLDQTELDLQARQAQAAYNAAQVAYNNSRNSYSDQSAVIPAQIAYDEAKTAYEQTKKLYEAGGASKSSLDTAKDRMDTTAAQLKAASTSSKGGADAAKAQLSSAKAALDLAVSRRNNCSVKAPMNGQILSCSIVPGDIASQQVPSMVIYDPKTVVLKINISEADINNVAIGMAAEITLQATEENFTGTVAKIAPKIDTTTGTFEVEVETLNDSGKLKVGMAAEVKLKK